MTIGIFDSGIGGLIVAKALIRALPEYDYIYLGDTRHVPYGGRSAQQVYTLSKKAVQFLFDKQCSLVIMACNTASAVALRSLQQIDLPSIDPSKRILGMVIPTAETVRDLNVKRVGLLATQATIDSKIYETEIAKLDPTIQMFGQAAPLLVPIVENDGFQFVDPILDHYLRPLQENDIEALILGCTHYPALRNQLKNKLGTTFPILGQDDIIPAKLQGYLVRHTEMEQRLTKNARRRFLLTDYASSYESAVRSLFDEEIPFELVSTM